MNSFRQTAVGIFVLVGLVCVAYLTVKLGRMELFEQKGFELTARFGSVSGLRVGADVEMAGVPVGRVAAITLDDNPAMPRALVRMVLDRDLHLSEDTIASVKTSGLIGDKYINLQPGGLPDKVAAGGELTETESAVDLESLLAKYVFGGV
ncbi:MAG TPA: outer membrane lipid asymmetry maintenance protein MlaD [Candidatus Desulfovibrio intestinavium]|uniref:Outer membrane lipid asymmetry maintenance protein MlaD n=1 Tax=Candidatus Desulfovibrio intestinavium TaxID=2838534 RepID=A0A9D2HMP1_9BACT|nr:outer membrane lipid asymmetry maintenance protein MlaD [Candidatus Desulfovibrio intestinavium]